MCFAIIVLCYLTMFGGSKLKSKNKLLLGWKVEESPENTLINFMSMGKRKKTNIYIQNHKGCLNNPDNYGYTPFILYVGNISSDDEFIYMTSLVERGANIMQNTFNNHNCLMISVLYSYPPLLIDIFNYFVQKGIDINDTDYQNNTIMDLSINRYKDTKFTNELYNLIVKIKTLGGVSNKYQKLNYMLPDEITEWILSNLETSSYYNIIYDEQFIEPPHSKINKLGNISLIITPINNSKTTDKIKALSLLSEDELEALAISEICKDVVPSQINNKLPSYADVIKNNSNRGSKLHIYKFNKKTHISKSDLECIGCTNNITNIQIPFATFHPCKHSILCIDCVTGKTHGNYYTSCPRCHISIDYITYVK